MIAKYQNQLFTSGGPSIAIIINVESEVHVTKHVFYSCSVDVGKTIQWRVRS